MRTYQGIAASPIGGVGARDWVVTVVDPTGSRPLPLHSRHSPTGHSWGYGGSGPAQLALDLLWDALGYEPPSTLYQHFKFEVVALWPQEADWVMTDDEIRDWVNHHRRAHHEPA